MKVKRCVVEETGDFGASAPQSRAGRHGLSAPVSMKARNDVKFFHRRI